MCVCIKQMGIYCAESCLFFFFKAKQYILKMFPCQQDISNSFFLKVTHNYIVEMYNN